MKPFRVLTKPFRVLTKPFRVLTKPFRVLTKPFRVLTKPFRVLTKPFLLDSDLTMPSGDAGALATLAFLVVLRVLIKLFFSIDMVSVRSCLRFLSPADDRLKAWGMPNWP
jgi:hypothetical protein